MLITTPENLLREAQAAEAHAKKHLECFADIIQTFVGSYYRNDMKPVNPAPENYPYSYVANVRPRLVFNNPRFTCNTENATIPSKALLLMAKFVNRWAVNEKLAQNILVPMVTQALLLRATVLTTFEDDPGQNAVGPEDLRRKMPHCVILENRRYFRDMVSTPAVKPRFKGHLWVRDLEDVKKMPDVNKEAVDSLIADVDIQKLERPSSRAGNAGEMPDRYEIIAYEIWVPECNDYRTDPNQHGTIFTVACGQSVRGAQRTRGEKAAFLFKPRPYYGPSWGPYTELEFVDVPTQTFGTSPVAVVMQQVEELNAHLSATADAAARMKHLIFVDAAQDTLQVALQNAPDGSVVGVPGVTKDQVIPALIGGPAVEQYQYNEAVRQRLDRNIGMDAAQRGGSESAGKTATETNVRFQSLNVRMVDLKRATSTAVKQIANTVAWYGWHSNNVVMPLSMGDGRELGKRNPVFLGGPGDGEKLPDWDDAALELEPYSMEAPDEEKLAQEVLEVLALITELAQMMQQAPWIGYDTILAQVAKLRKFSWLEECINSQLFAEWMKEQVQQAMEQHQMEQALQGVQVEIAQAELAMKRLQLVQMMRGGGEEGDKGPSVSISYKDLPEDIKRQAEAAAGFQPSTQPLTSPAHISNAMAMHEAGENRTHKTALQRSQQEHQTKQTRLAGMFKDMAGRRGNGMGSNSQRAQVGPTKTASRGQRAFAESRR